MYGTASEEPQHGQWVEREETAIWPMVCLCRSRCHDHGKSKQTSKCSRIHRSAATSFIKIDLHGLYYSHIVIVSGELLPFDVGASANRVGDLDITFVVILFESNETMQACRSNRMVFVSVVL